MTSSKRVSAAAATLVAVAALAGAGSALADGSFFKSRRTAAPAATKPVPPAGPVQTAPPPQAPLPETEPATPAESVSPPEPAVAAAAPQPISGSVNDVISTDTLVVAGQRLRLVGVRGEAGTFVPGLRQFLASAGNQVTCEPAGNAWLCKTPNGLDVGQIVIFNGAGRAGPGASAEYQAAEAQARAQGKGVWAQR